MRQQAMQNSSVRRLAGGGMEQRWTLPEEAMDVQSEYQGHRMAQLQQQVSSVQKQAAAMDRRWRWGFGFGAISWLMWILLTYWPVW